MPYRITTDDRPHNGQIDMSLIDTSTWHKGPFTGPGSAFAAVFFGDAQLGPFAALNAVAPRDSPLPTSAGHGHRCDSWRVSIDGTMRMGALKYGPGAFRFQEGGRIYGADDVSWGPHGGQSVVVMADRRGSTAIPAWPKDAERFKKAAKMLDEWLDAPPRVEHPIVPGIATSFGKPRLGHVNGSFAQGEAWRFDSPGVQLEAGLAGDREGGPLILLVRAQEGRTAFPRLRLATEVLHVVVGGSARDGGGRLQRAESRLAGENTDAPALVAEEHGVWLASLIGDRRALAAAQCEDEAWLGRVKQTLADLSSQFS